MIIKGYQILQKDIDRFYSKISKNTEGKYTGCHEITCAKNNGYSVFTVKRSKILAHRFIYQIIHPDEDIDDKQICHKCDNPGCVNPDHLFSGTLQDNMDDKVSKDRQSKGSKHGRSILTEENIDEIINNTLSGYFTSCYDIAKYYNISYTYIFEIINQKFWKHVTKDRDMVKVKSLLDNRVKGSKSLKAAFSDDQVREIRVRLKNGETRASLADFYHVDQSTIRKISSGKSYQDVV